MRSPDKPISFYWGRGGPELGAVGVPAPGDIAGARPAGAWESVPRAPGEALLRRVARDPGLRRSASPGALPGLALRLTSGLTGLVACLLLLNLVSLSPLEAFLRLSLSLSASLFPSLCLWIHTES